MIDEAVGWSRRSTCIRRQAGCVLANKRGHVISTGYNGVARDLPHCIDVPCAGAKHASGCGLGECEAIHAEANALLQCKDVFEIHTAYCTTAPCADQCVKMLMNTSCKRIVFLDDYPQSAAAKRLWTKYRDREWIQFKKAVDPVIQYWVEDTFD